MNPFLSVVLEHLLPIVAAAVGIVVIALAKKAVNVFETKTSIEISDQHEALLAGLLEKAVARGEEWAHGKVKLGESAPTGAQKLDQALDFAVSEAERLGLDVKAEEHLKKLIEAQLGLVRSDAAVAK